MDASSFSILIVQVIRFVKKWVSDAHRSLEVEMLGKIANFIRIDVLQNLKLPSSLMNLGKTVLELLDELQKADEKESLSSHSFPPVALLSPTFFKVSSSLFLSNNLFAAPQRHFMRGQRNRNAFDDGRFPSAHEHTLQRISALALQTQSTACP